MGGRTDQQCMGRWRRHLDPTVTRGAWARDEDELLCGLYDEYGPRWSFICQSVPGRTAQQCRARWFQVDGKPREERDHRPSRRQSPVETSSHGPAEDHPARRFSDHEGLVTRTSIDSMPMASLSPTPVAEKRPFSHILAEVSARTTQKTGSLIRIRLHSDCARARFAGDSLKAQTSIDSAGSDVALARRRRYESRR